MAGKFYAVKKGRKPGIYMSWDASTGDGISKCKIQRI